jgi:AcrR family transcriptional regulator
MSKKERNMPRDKTENHEKIVAAAYEEFLKYGFMDASMRRIADACNMSASGLYKHFPSKEEMFAALVEPAYEGLKKTFFQIADQDIGIMENSFHEEAWDENEETVWTIHYIYEHYQAFKLLICKSQGTRFENFTHELVLLEEESTIKYMRKLKKLGIRVNRVPKKELHLFVTTSINAIFLTVEHDFSKKDALLYARHLDAYNTAGWKKLFLD